MFSRVDAEPPRISVVIPTYQRCEECKQAVRSALDQEYSPLEVLVCDDGSTDGTEDFFREWAQSESRLRYLRLSRNHGSPAPARNAGIQEARGDWIGLLDSDDRWLPDKLAVQHEFISSDRYDVVASDAKTDSGEPYLDLSATHEPEREEFLHHNPIIVSTAVARRSLLLVSGGFPQSVGRFKITGVEDYGAWLNLVTRGARFLVIPRPLVEYAGSGDRMSTAIARQEWGVAAVRWGLWMRRPVDAAVFGSAMRGTLDAVRVRRSSAG